MTGWEVYNTLTLRYKPEVADIPLIPMNFAAVETIVNLIEGKRAVAGAETEVIE